MTTAIPESDTARAHWACVQLRVPIAAPPEEIRAACFDGVRQSEFAPNADVAEAVRILSGHSDQGSAAVHSEYSHAKEQSLLQAAEAFAGKFFELTHLERRARWQELMREAQPYPIARQRLRELHAGLELPASIPADAPPHVAELMRVIRKLFVAPPAAKSQLRRRLIRSARSGDIRVAGVAAHLVSVNYPGTAGLDPELIDRLRFFHYGTYPKRAAVAPPQAKPKAAQRHPVPFTQPIQPARLGGEGESGFPPGAMVAIAIAVSVVVGLLRGATSSHTPTSHVNIPSMTFPSSTSSKENSFRWIYRSFWPPGVIRAITEDVELTREERALVASATIRVFRRQESVGNSRLCLALSPEEAAKLRQILATVFRDEFGDDDEEPAIAEIEPGDEPAIAEIPSSSPVPFADISAPFTAEELQHVLAIVEARARSSDANRELSLEHLLDPTRPGDSGR